MTFGTCIIYTCYVIEYSFTLHFSFQFTMIFFYINLFYVPAISNHVVSNLVSYICQNVHLAFQTFLTKKLFFDISGSISNIEDDQSYRCSDGSSPEIQNKVISGVVAAASSVTSIQVANLLKLFKIPQVIKILYRSYIRELVLYLLRFINY